MAAWYKTVAQLHADISGWTARHSKHIQVSGNYLLLSLTACNCLQDPTLPAARIQTAHGEDISSPDASRKHWAACAAIHRTDHPKSTTGYGACRLVQVAYPLMTLLTCLEEDSIFRRSIDTLTETLTRQLRVRS